MLFSNRSHFFSTPDIVDVAAPKVEAVFLDASDLDVELETVNMIDMSVEEMIKVYTDHGYKFGKAPEEEERCPSTLGEMEVLQKAEL